MSNRRLNTRLPKPPATTISPRPQVVAHKSTGGILNSFPEPVDPVGNASQRLTNDTVALPRTGEVARLKTVRSESARVRDLGKQILPPALSKGFWHRGPFLFPLPDQGDCGGVRLW